MSTNACLSLCYFLEQCRKSQAPPLRSMAYSRETCQDLFTFYVEWNEGNHHRSMRQVLELMGSLVSKNPDEAVVASFKGEALNRLVSIIKHQSAQPLVKPAFRMLDYLLSKGVFTVSELLAAHACVSGNEIEVGSSAQWDAFVSDVFEWMSLPDTASAAGKLLVTLFAALGTKTGEATSHSANWQRWVQLGLEKRPETLENVKNYLFLPLFKLDKPGSMEFLRSLPKHQPIDSVVREIDSHASILLAAMEVGKKLGYVDDIGMSDYSGVVDERKASAKKRDYIPLPCKTIGGLLRHPVASVRSSALSVLVLSLSSTKPFAPETLSAITQYLFILHAETDAKCRNELFTNSKYMLERLRGALSLMARESEQDEAKCLGLRQHIQGHEDFLGWYLDFLARELVPTASYQRHITSLKSLGILLKTGIQASSSIGLPPSQHDTFWPRQIDIFSPSLVRLLLDLVVDPFEEVRNCSISVLNYAPMESFGPLIDTPHGTVPKLVKDLAARAKAASSQTGRADVADGLAHTHVLEFKCLDTTPQRLQMFEAHLAVLEADIQEGLADLDRASATAPVHGQFATLRQLWQLMQPDTFEGVESRTSESLQRRLVKCCVDTWEVVKPALCNDSPEGNVPSSFSGSQIDVKSILSYSFRACHESRYVPSRRR